ncbi:hypothetical protein [uncultured Enterococcus sp.]|uniref:hypothetical protein n=1 Tax=uncultured Enterococcus sp. TaxID=167972 RepID=UPI002AA72F7C|nr:hypothetical protein [uncultured Enterococcus sp.]
MKVVKIEYPTTLDKIEDITDDNIDIFVTLGDGHSYTLIIATLKNIQTLMGNQDFLRPGLSPQFIIVKELNEKIIEKAIEAHAEEDDGFWIKQSHLSTEFYPSELDDILEKRRKLRGE